MVVPVVEVGGVSTSTAGADESEQAASPSTMTAAAAAATNALLSRMRISLLGVREPRRSGVLLPVSCGARDPTEVSG